MDNIQHIFEHMEPDEFNFDEVGVKFNGDSLVLFHDNRYIPIEELFDIIRNKRKVKKNDFSRELTS